MIDLQTLVPLRDVPDLLPCRRGRKVHLSTIYRWAERGVRGVRLESTRIGGVTYTSRQALQRFVGRLSDGPSTPTVVSTRDDQRDAAELDRDGVG